MPDESAKTAGSSPVGEKGEARPAVPIEKKGEASPAASFPTDGSEYGLFTHEKAKMDHEHRQQAGMLGWLGMFFGGGEEKAGNVAGLLIVLCFSAIVGLLLSADMWESVDATGAVLGAVLTACLGYLFGRK